MKKTRCKHVNKLVLATILAIIILSATLNGKWVRSSQSGNFEVIYDSEKDAIIVVAGNGDFLDLVGAIHNDTLLRETGAGIFLVLRNLTIGKDVTLTIEGPRIAWVKLLSNADRAVRFEIQGSVEILNSKITSWNEVAQAPYTLSEPSRPRAHILVQGGRLDIISSEVSYLGYSYSRSYGISYYNSGSNRIENSVLSYNYRSFYSVNSTNFVIAGNRIFGCYSYGLDPFERSSQFLLENNTVYANGAHGIIISTLANGNIIRNNHVFNNTGHGIMLHDMASSNSVYSNYVATNGLEGIVVFNSSLNEIYSNTIVGNENGIRLSELSTHNEIRNNTVDTSRVNGIYVYDHSDNNVFLNNVITKSGNVGFYIKDSTGNVLRNNTIASSASEDLNLVRAQADIDSSNRIGPSTNSTVQQHTSTSSSIGVISRVLGFGALASFAVGFWFIQSRRLKKTRMNRTDADQN